MRIVDNYACSEIFKDLNYGDVFCLSLDDTTYYMKIKELDKRIKDTILNTDNGNVENIDIYKTVNTLNLNTNEVVSIHEGTAVYCFKNAVLLTNGETD